MRKKDKRIDAYIANAQPFAKRILKHLRALVHEACPDVEETIKWGVPHFEFKGKILCSMASFKQHCAFGFRLGSLMADKHGLMKAVGTASGMGHFGRISDVKDLPPDKTLIEYIHEAMLLTDEGAKRKKTAPEANELEVPEYFIQFLKKDKEAFRTFESFSYSRKKDYVEWITEAKTEQTRNRRMATAVEWLREGKGRNWKYEDSKFKIQNSKLKPSQS